MANYKNVVLTKDLYKGNLSFSELLEKMDPTANYKGTDLGGLDAFQRQLKRFDIKVSGPSSDPIAKFFSTSDSAALFPEFVSRAVNWGMTESSILDSIIATKTVIHSMDYRTILSQQSEDDMELKVVAEGGFIPQTTIRLKDHLVHLCKRGRMLLASYEAIRFQSTDVVSIALKQIGSYIAKSQLKDAIDVLISGDGNEGTKAMELTTKTSGTLTYEDLINLWDKFEDYEMNTLVVSPDMMRKMLAIKELADPATGLNFQGTGALSTPLGAKLYKSSAVPENTIIAMDKRYALEMVSAGNVQVEADKLIDCQLERAAITSTTGFSILCPGAVCVLRCKA